MNLLLDTHALIWWLQGDRKLGANAAARIAERRNGIWVSAASAWEIAIKTALGRMRFDDAPDVVLPMEIERSGFFTLPITLPHAFAVGGLPPHHSDPFDRMLIAQAQIEGFHVVTADTAFAAYSVPIVPADE